MGIAAYSRGSNAIKQSVTKELNLGGKILAETLELAKIRRAKRDEWRRDAMSFMIDSYMFKQCQKHMSTRKGYQIKRNAMLNAHIAWIDACGELELNQASNDYAQAVYNYISWIVAGWNIADEILSQYR